MTLFFLLLSVVFNFVDSRFLNWNVSHSFNDTIITAGSSLHIIGEKNSIWLCGGYFLNSCYHIKISLDSGWTPLSQSKSIKLTTPRGYEQMSTSFFSQSTNEGGYNMNTNKACFIGLNIGTNTHNQCMCCTINDNGKTIKCNDISQINDQCLDRFQSCVVHDKYNDNIIQIGGLKGNKLYDEINCFDTNTQTFIKTDDNEKLQKKCKFGGYTLDTKYGGNWMSGCTMVTETILIIVGGDYQHDIYSKKIQICNSDPLINGCHISLNSFLDEGVLYPEVIRISDCHVLIMGGALKNGGTSNNVYKYNVCTDSIEDKDILPIENGMSLFNVFVGNEFLCIFGGITTDDKYYEQSVQNMYCSLLAMATDNESETITTTMYPTNMPTKNPITTLNPTISPIDISTEIIDMNEWEYFEYTYKSGRTAQICASDNDHAFFFGGIVWTANGKKYSKETTEFIAVSIDSSITQYKVFEYDDNYDNMPMLKMACTRPCSAYWKNNLFVVMPNNKAVFYQCTIDNVNEQLKCKDICNGDGLVHQQCQNLGYEACITSHENLLFIIGGAIGNQYKTSILIWDMNINEWIDSNQLFYGELPIPLIASTCAIYEKTKLLIFGGLSTQNDVLDDIYECNANDGACSVIHTKLQQPQYMAQARVVGKNVIISCGDTQDNHPIATVEVFDAIKYTIKTGPTLQNPRKYCCMVDFNHSLLISGGDMMTSEGDIVGADNIIESRYELTIEDEIDDTSDNTHYDPIINCMQYHVISSDQTFNTIFYNAGELATGYYIWLDNKDIVLDDSKYMIVFKPNEKCWIGGGDIWAFNIKEPYLIIGDSPDWIITYSDYTTKYINIEITCVSEYAAMQIGNGIDNNNNNEDNSNGNFIFGFTKKVFIVILVSAAIVLLFLFIICVTCIIRYKKIRRIKQRNHALKRTKEDYDDVSSKRVTITPNMLFSDPASVPFQQDVNFVTNAMGYYGDDSDTDIFNLSDE